MTPRPHVLDRLARVFGLKRLAPAQMTGGQPIDRDALVAQLRELNERSRTYARQFWQLPLAYLAASGVALTQIIDRGELPLRLALITSGLVGIFIIWHLVGVCRASRRSFDAIRTLEAKLSLPEDATRWTPAHLYALITLTILWALLSLGAGLYLTLSKWAASGGHHTMSISWVIDLAGVATVALAVIAAIALWVASRQLSALIKQTRVNTLVTFHERYNTDPVLGFRQEVWNLMAEVAEDVKTAFPGLSEADAQAKTRATFAKRLEELRNADRPRYFRLFGLVNFFETVGYLVNAKYIPLDDTLSLFRAAILQAGEVFEPWIRKTLEEPSRHRDEWEWFLWLVGQARHRAK